jgi:hypothetical protein
MQRHYRLPGRLQVGRAVKEQSGDSGNNEFRETTAPKSPRELESEIVRFNNDSEKWLAVVGILHERPYEVFTGKAEGFYLPTYVDKGWVIKNRLENGEKRYDFQFLDRDGYKVTIEGLSVIPQGILELCQADLRRASSWDAPAIGD